MSYDSGSIGEYYFELTSSLYAVASKSVTPVFSCDWVLMSVYVAFIVAAVSCRLLCVLLVLPRVAVYTVHV